MLALEKWATGRSFLIATIAPQVAAAACELHLGFAQLKRRRIYEHPFPLPPLPAWFRLYRSHRKPVHFARTLFAKFFPSGPLVIEFVETWLQFLQSHRLGKVEFDPASISPEALAEALELLQHIQAASFEDIRNNSSDEPVDPATRDRFEQLTDEFPSECSFYFLVHVPCWLLYRTSPTRLYRKARTGSVVALEKLLALDALMMHDPSLGRQIQRLRFLGKAKAYRTLHEAPLKGPKAKIDRKRMKYAVAGFISAVAVIAKQKLTERDIHDLFDAVAKDTTKDPLAVDPDLIVSPQTFSKAIYRERTFWLKAFRADKKI